MENQIKEKIRWFFYFGLDIKLDDSPQILTEYLYIEFWGNKKQQKFRIPYPIGGKDIFLKMSDTAREHYIMRHILSGVLS